MCALTEVGYFEAADAAAVAAGMAALPEQERQHEQQLRSHCMAVLGSGRADGMAASLLIRQLPDSPQPTTLHAVAAAVRSHCCSTRLLSLASRRLLRNNIHIKTAPPHVRPCPFEGRHAQLLSLGRAPGLLALVQGARPRQPASACWSPSRAAMASRPCSVSTCFWYSHCVARRKACPGRGGG